MGETAIRNQVKVLHWMTEDVMPKFIIERTIPGAGALDRQQPPSWGGTQEALRLARKRR